MKANFKKPTALLAIIAFAAAAPGLWAADTTALLGELNSTAKTTGDSTLSSLAGDLGTKVQSLTKSLGGNADANAQLQSAVQSLLGNKGVESLDALQKLGQAKLTPEQTKLAKEVKNIGGAYIVQKNFSSLDGSQTEVAQVVNSLRKGDTANALPPLKKISENAKLTQPQKDLLTSVANRYAPGAAKAEGALKSIKSLPGFGK